MNHCTVWDVFTPYAPGHIRLDTYGSDYDTVAAVYTGFRGGWTLVVPADPAYADQAIAFLVANVLNQWEGLPVNFLGTYLSTVGFGDAFPSGDGDPGLLPLFDLELWGLPTSRPAYDPSNHNFVYQRFQRGILH